MVFNSIQFALSCIALLTIYHFKSSYNLESNYLIIRGDCVKVIFICKKRQIMQLVIMYS